VSALPAESVGRVLFTREVRKDGRQIVLLSGIEREKGAVTVEASVFPVGSKAGAEPRRRPFSFATRDQALRFVDDALDALEYLDCQVVE
jgi:hypothetical protein